MLAATFLVLRDLALVPTLLRGNITQVIAYALSGLAFVLAGLAIVTFWLCGPNAFAKA